MSLSGERSLNRDISRRELLRGVVRGEDSGGGISVAVISDTCLALNNVACRNCDDACEERAIRFHPRLGGHYTPKIDADACTACGECISVCPVSAISIRGGQRDV